MDNFAVTLAAGASRRSFKKSLILQISFLFTLAHLIMFSGGWLLGRGIGFWIHAIDHWIAFIILTFIGIRMIQESRETKPDSKFQSLHTLKTRLLLAAATSVDAWMVGMGLSFAKAPFWWTVAIMMLCVFITSWVGFKLGAWLGRKIGPVMETCGGIILILIGVKLLLEGMGIC